MLFRSLVETAKGGTLFLDEMGDVPLSMQVKLLRLIESGTYRRVGSTELRHTDLRVVAATHRDLRMMVGQGSFREDLYFRLSVMSVDLPPGRIFGSGTVLDSSRFRYLIAEKADLSVSNVHGYIVGEHGDSEISLWSSVSIGGVPADEFRLDGKLLFDKETQSAISHDVVNAAYEIIEGKGATNLAIGLSTARIIEAIRGHQHRVLPVSTLQTGAYGIDDVCLSLPTVVTAEGAGKVLEIPLSDAELAGLQASAQTLHDAWGSVQGA